MRRMYSKKELEEIISEMSGDILEVKNVKQLTDAQCNGLKVGDIVAKKTGKQYHLYQVTFKQDKSGLCLSYFDASVVETQSYDYTDGHWVYNSEDKGEFKSDAQIKALAKDEVESATAGTIADVIGLDAGGKMVKGAVSGGNKYYKHHLSISNIPSSNNYGECDIITSNPNQLTQLSDLVAELTRLGYTSQTKCLLIQARSGGMPPRSEGLLFSTRINGSAPHGFVFCTFAIYVYNGALKLWKYGSAYKVVDGDINADSDPSSTSDLSSPTIYDDVIEI